VRIVFGFVRIIQLLQVLGEVLDRLNFSLAEVVLEVFAGLVVVAAHVFLVLSIVLSAQLVSLS
jgi:hypothetical protein